jgi:chromosomal replication initiator protein
VPTLARSGGGTQPPQTKDAATALAGAIARRIGQPRYQLWFARHTRFDCDGDRLVVGVPNRHFQEWLERTFSAAVEEAAAEVFGRALPVRWAIDPSLFQAARAEQARADAAPVGDDDERPGKGKKRVAGAESAKPRGARRGSPTPPLGGPKVSSAAPGRPSAQPLCGVGDPRTAVEPPPVQPSAAPRRARRWHKLGEFVVGPCNRVAHAAALSVVEAPGEAANPLVFYGPVGTGKTHLLEGVYAALRRAHPDWRVSYVTSEEFTNRFVQAMRHGRLAGFRKQFRDCDVLLVDDLHFLATKKATQEEFLHTFDALVADGRQLVLTCDCHPRLADDFAPELIDRLLGGAVWSLTPPDADTRLAILRAKARPGEAGAVPDEALAFLAGQLRGNVRELEGAIHSVRHYSRVTGRPIDVPLVREAVADLLRHAVRVVQLADVDAAVCAALRLEPGTLQGRGRAWAVSHPRMVAMFLARKHTASSYSDVGRHFGGRNHSTVVAAEKKVRAWLAENAELSLGQRRVRVRELVERAERDLLR